MTRLEFTTYPTCLTLAIVATLAGFSKGQTGAPPIQEQLDELRRAVSESQLREAKLTERLSTVEQQLDEERRQHASSMADLEARWSNGAPGRLEELIAEVETIASSPAGRSALSVGGYFDFEFRDDEAAAHSTFDQHRFILQFDADIIPDAIEFRSEIEIEGGGADVSFLTGNQVAVEFAELRFRFHEAINLKVGALLVPFGRLNRLHDSPLQDLQDRPLVAVHVIPTTWTESGAGIFGAFDLGRAGRIDYDIIVSNGLDDDFSTTPGGGLRSARSSFRSDNNDDKMVLGRVGWQPDFQFIDAAEFGFSFAFGAYDDAGARDYQLFGVDWFLREGPFELKGEFADFDFERSAAELAAGVPSGADGWYAELAFHFFPDSWRHSSRFFTDESTFTLVARYGTTDTDDSARAIDRGSRGAAFRDDVERLTFGINFRPVEKTVIRFEYQIFFEGHGIADAENDRLVISFATYF